MSNSLLLKNCEITGPTRNTITLMDNAICLVSSSLLEGFLNVIIEAMARWLCVISINSADIVSNLANGINVIGVNIKDEIALSDAILRVFSESNLVDMSQRNIEIASKFKWSEISTS